jgi:hypothetical protein
VPRRARFVTRQAKNPSAIGGLGWIEVEPEQAD